MTHVRHRPNNKTISIQSNQNSIFFPEDEQLHFEQQMFDYIFYVAIFFFVDKVRNNKLLREKGILKTNKLNEPKMHFNNSQIKLEV